ncbi:4-hydroxythreonine-4-phosphate dehydrogenase PdxA [Arenibaculum pallidiluteum]|uniref:4-hydroxythreonine-4-phosphate dehydrogenase PdxA n=1 Tax=Arenibaculum pallidiluteum TaxID=2812559 RepID=UPI0038B3A61F
MTGWERPLALTMGEPAGIGGEIACMAWLDRARAGVPPFMLLDDPERIAALARAVGFDVPVRAVGDAEEAVAVFGTALPVLPLALPAAVTPGRPDPANGGAVIGSIDRAVALARAGEASAVVTNPIQKSVLYQAGFSHPGHTEYLAHLAGGTETVMMLEGGGIRVVPVTIHVPIAAVPGMLTTALILRTARILAQALRRDFGIAEPRLALAGLNPHAGEAGTIGREDVEVIAPAAEALRAEGIAARGPLPADTLFHAGVRRDHDAVLCMYHDQALIPLKTLDFDGGVNVTLGLPFVRTSPDHGTALGLAGTGRASPRSLVAALRTAARLAATRAVAPA